MSLPGKSKRIRSPEPVRIPRRAPAEPKRAPEKLPAPPAPTPQREREKVPA